MHEPQSVITGVAFVDVMPSRRARAVIVTRARVLVLRRCSYYAVTMASPTRQGQTKSVTAVRLPAELRVRLREAADERDLSVNFLVVKAVEDFLRRLVPADQIRLTRD